MNRLPGEYGWIDKARKAVAFGMFGYLASFFFLGASQQKTLFYLVVALPSILVLPDLQRIFREHKTSLILTIGYLTYFSISSFWSVEGEFLNSLKLALVIACLMIAAYTANHINADSSRVIGRYILIVGMVSSLFYLGIIAYKISVTDGFSILSHNRFSLRDLSSFGDGNPINSAIYLGLPVLAAFWTYPKSRPAIKILLLAFILTSFFIMFLTKSRGPILATAFVMTLIAGSRRSKNDLLLVGSIFAIVAALVFIFDLIPILLDRANAPNYRIEIWTKSILLIKDHLIFGQGAGESANISFATNGGALTVGHSHSSFLEAFRVGGLFGGALFLGLLTLALRRSFTVADDRGFFAFWLIYGLLCLSTNGRSVFIRPSIEWFCFWVPLFFAIFSSAPKLQNNGEQDNP